MASDFSVGMAARMHVDISVAAFNFTDECIDGAAGKRSDQIAASKRAGHGSAPEADALRGRTEQKGDYRSVFSRATQMDMGLRHAANIAQGKSEA